MLVLLIDARCLLPQPCPAGVCCSSPVCTAGGSRRSPVCAPPSKEDRKTSVCCCSVRCLLLFRPLLHGDDCESGGLSARGQAAEHKIEQLEGCVQTHRREVAGLETERHRLLRDVRKLRRSCKVRKVGRRPKPNCGINPAETEFRHLSCVNVRRNSLGSAPIGQNDVGPESGRVGRSDAADAGADARTGARRASSRRGRHPCVEVEEGGGEGGGSGASSPLVSVSVLSEPSSDSPSKWLLSDRRVLWTSPRPFVSQSGEHLFRNTRIFCHPFFSHRAEYLFRNVRIPPAPPPALSWQGMSCLLPHYTLSAGAAFGPRGLCRT